jgi:hypothetical protein
VNRFDVNVYGIRRRPKRHRPFEVRWVVAGRARSKSFITRALADSYRAELVRAARKGLEFDPATGEPVRWAEPEPVTVTWYQHAVAHAAMKWPALAAHSRASLAEALATVTPALTWAVPGRPHAAALCAALYRHAFNPGHSAPANLATTQVLDWVQRASLPVARLGRADGARPGAGGPHGAAGWPMRRADREPGRCEGGAPSRPGAQEGNGPAHQHDGDGRLGDPGTGGGQGPGLAVREPGQVKKRSYRQGGGLQAHHGGDSAGAAVAGPVDVPSRWPCAHPGARYPSCCQPAGQSRLPRRADIGFGCSGGRPGSGFQVPAGDGQGAPGDPRLPGRARPPSPRRRMGGQPRRHGYPAGRPETDPSQPMPHALSVDSACSWLWSSGLADGGPRCRAGRIRGPLACARPRSEEGPAA